MGTNANRIVTFKVHAWSLCRHSSSSVHGSGRGDVSAVPARETARSSSSNGAAERVNQVASRLWSLRPAGGQVERHFSQGKQHGQDVLQGVRQVQVNYSVFLFLFAFLVTSTFAERVAPLCIWSLGLRTHTTTTVIWSIWCSLWKRRLRWWSVIPRSRRN